MPSKKSRRTRIALFSACLLALALVPTAVAGKPGHGGGGSCTRNAPGVSVENTFGWGQWGSYGLAGQQLKYAVDVFNHDVGCSSSTFTVSLSAPGGFSVSMPTNSVSLKSGTVGYLWANVTSPSVVADGDYPLTVTVTRTGTTTGSSSGTAVSYYKVYSSDSVAPTLYWPNPADGMTIAGRSYNVVVDSNDDHAVKRIDLYIDNAYKTETVCEAVSYACSLNYAWSPVSGAHTATFKSYDWLGNVGVLTVNFTVA
jgi:hypothetical protein